MKSVICKKCRLKLELTVENANALGGTIMYHIMMDHPELKDKFMKRFMAILTDYFIIEEL